MEIQESRSVVVNSFGSYGCISIKNFALLELKGHIEVKVEYGGLNFADLYTRQGLVSYKQPPFVLGIECTGTVTAIGVENTELKVGQRVICYDYKGGMFRDKIRVTPDKCYLLPDFINSEIGATLFVNYLTAYFVLIGLGNLREEENVLIMSCAGGVGCAATQLARTIRDVKIFGTGSEGKEELAKDNGVDVFYTNKLFQTEVADQKFDLILANETGNTFSFLKTLLNPLGRIIAIGANDMIVNENRISIFDMLKVWWRTKSITIESLIINNQLCGGLHLGTLIEKDPNRVRKALNYIFELIKAGKIKPIIHITMPMSKIIEATKLLGERKNVGKVLIRMEELDKEETISDS